MDFTEPHDAASGSAGETFFQVRPVSVVTFTRPSLLPVHRRPARTRDSAIAMSVPPYSTPMLSGVSPPEICCLLLSLRVRSGDISRQLRPPLVVTCTYW